MKKTKRKATKKAPARRTPSVAQREADESALQAFEKGEFLAVPEAQRTAAIARFRQRQQARDEAKSIAKDLGRIRQAFGLTQERLANAIGVDKSDISRAESGRHVPSLERVLITVKAIEQFAGVSITSPGDTLLEEIYTAIGTAESFLDSRPLDEASK